MWLLLYFLEVSKAAQVSWFKSAAVSVQVIMPQAIQAQALFARRTKSKQRLQDGAYGRRQVYVDIDVKYFGSAAGCRFGEGCNYKHTALRLGAWTSCASARASWSGSLGAVSPALGGVQGWVLALGFVDRSGARFLEVRIC